MRASFRGRLFSQRLFSQRPVIISFAVLVSFFANVGIGAGCTDDMNRAGNNESGDGGSGSDGGGGRDSGNGDHVVVIPSIAYCEPAQNWPTESNTWEFDVLALVNQRRSEGANCGGTSLGPAPALSMNGALSCAARVHSWDMATQGYFDHSSQNGDQPWDRMTKAGYNWRAAGENIAMGQANPTDVMNAWMSSQGHCQNIMNPDFVDIGIGYHGASGSKLWTQVFGRP